MADQPVAKRSRVDDAHGRAARLVSWLHERGATMDGLEIRATPSGLGVFATRALAPGQPLGFLPRDAILDPLVELDSDSVARRALGLGSTAPFAFWLSLACNSKNESHPFFPYLAALPREAPDPCAWPPAERELLAGTQLGTQVEAQRRLLESEFERIAPKVLSEAGLAGVAFEDLLWARGIHLSRCFPRAMVEAATLVSPHEILASDQIDASLRVEHGDNRAPRVTWSASSSNTAAATESVGREEEAASADGTEAAVVSEAGVLSKAGDDAASSVPSGAEANGSGTGAGNDSAAGNLGCMLPLFDMLEHRCGHPIGWESGGGGVRFRCRVDVEPNAPVYNNYGPKGNQELLFTYGFAVDDNSLDAVEGIMVGIPPSDDSKLREAQLKLLTEHEIEHSVRADGALLIGPFEAWSGVAAAKQSASNSVGDGALDGAADEADAASETEASGLLRPELLLALQVIGMEDADDEPALSLDELDLLRATLSARLNALLPSEEADSRAPANTRRGFVAAYRRGQRRVLMEALAEVEQMAEGGEEAEDGEN